MGRQRARADDWATARCGGDETSLARRRRRSKVSRAYSAAWRLDRHPATRRPLAPTQTKTALFASANTNTNTNTHATQSRTRVLGGSKETAQTRELDNEGILQQQTQVMQEQEEDVLALGRTVARLKEMGGLMEEEVAVQNAMLGVVDADASRLQGKVDVARRRVGGLG